MKGEYSQYIYKIRRYPDWKWSMGGIPPTWNEKVEHAKIWKNLKDVKRHLAQIYNRVGNIFCYQDCEVVKFKVKREKGESIDVQSLWQGHSRPSKASQIANRIKPKHQSEDFSEWDEFEDDFDGILSPEEQKDILGDE